MPSMYNKLFTKILDSSIWLAPDPHRLVWITLLAAMDEDSNVMFASHLNLAARARVSPEEALEAITAFESPDPYSGDPDNEGRRVERIPGGWHVLNGQKYRALVTKAVARERTRERVAKFRAKAAGNGDVTTRNARVTPSEAEAEARSEADLNPSVADATSFGEVERVFSHWQSVWNKPRAKLDAKRRKVIREALKAYGEADVCAAITGYTFSPHHMGQNDRNTVYDDIGLFLRDSKHIDAGLRFNAAPPRTDLSQKTMRIVAQTENWVPPEMRNATG